MPYQIYDPTDQMWYTGPDGVGRGGHGWSATRDAAVTYATLRDAHEVSGNPFLSGVRALQVLRHTENPPAATPLQTPARAGSSANRAAVSSPYFLYQSSSGNWVGAAGLSTDYDSAREFSRDDAESLAAAEPGLALYGTFRGVRRPVYPSGAPRRVMSVTSDIGRLIAVDADGIMWVLERCADEWTLLPQLPRMLINQPGA